MIFDRPYDHIYWHIIPLSDQSEITTTGITPTGNFTLERKDMKRRMNASPKCSPQLGLAEQKRSSNEEEAADGVVKRSQK